MRTKTLNELKAVRLDAQVLISKLSNQIQDLNCEVNKLNIEIEEAENDKSN